MLYLTYAKPFAPICGLLTHSIYLSISFLVNELPPGTAMPIISSELLNEMSQYLNYTNLIIFSIISIIPVGLSIYFNNTKKDNS